MTLFKRILAVIFLIAFVALSWFGYRHFMRVNAPVAEAISAVPPSAGLIFETNDLTDLWDDVSEANIMWEALMKGDFFHHLDSIGSQLDSLVQEDKMLQDLLNGQKVVFSAHMDGAKSYSFMASVPMPRGYEPQKVVAHFEDRFENTEWSERKYDGTPVYEIKVDGRTLSFIIESGVFVCSFSSMLVEDAIRHLHSGTSLVAQQAYKEVRRTAGRNVDGNLYLNFDELPELFSTYLDPSYNDALLDKLAFGEWAELDLTLKPDAIMLNGFIFSGPENSNFINIFKEQEPQNMALAHVLPSNTAFLYNYGWSNSKEFFARRESYLEQSNQYYEYEKQLDKIDDRCDCDLKESIYSWIGNEAGIGVLEPSKGESIDDNSLIVVGVAHMKGAKENMDKLVNSYLTGEEKEKSSTRMFRGMQIHQLPERGVFRTLLGAPFPLLDHPYFIFLDDHLVLAPHQGLLRDVINAYKAGKTLARDVNYDSFTENLSQASNLFIYSNIGRSPYLYSQFLASEYADQVGGRVDLFREFQAFGIQFITSDNGLFYNNIYLEYDPVYKKETSSLWEIALDTSVTKKPWLVTNHYSHFQEILVQDESEKIYLISNTGKVLWTKQLPEKIMGKVHQIDRYHNNKLQLLFNTKSRLYLLDREGRHVEDYPVELKSPATAPLALFDYSNNKNYRILIPGENKELYNYDKSGQLVKGWDFTPGESVVNRTPQHIRISTNKKDYILTVEENGKVHLLNRRGQPRYKVEEKIYPAEGSELTIEESKNISISELVYSDTVGNVVKLQFGGQREQVGLENVSGEPGYIYRDVDEDGRRDHIFTHDKELSVFTADESHLFGFGFDSTLTNPPMYFSFPDGASKVGVVDRKASQAYLFSKTGTLVDGMPLFGSTPMSIGDINKDGTLEVVIGHRDGNIYTYSLKD